MRVLLPVTLDEALAHKAAGAVPVAGATDLWVHWPVRPEAQDETYVDLSALDSLRPIIITDTWLTLGALTTYWDVITHPVCKLEFPILIEAARQVGAIQIQSRGTWAGNIANASPAADGVLAMMALGAQVVLSSHSGGERTVPLEAFYLGYKKMDTRPDELVTAIRLPRERTSFARFIKVGARRAQAITKVGVALVRRGESWIIAVNSMAPTIKRCPGVESILSGSSPPAMSRLRDALANDVSPIDDIRSDREYRLEVAARVLHHAIAGAFNERRLS